jgi:hypothetical protein
MPAAVTIEMPAPSAADATQTFKADVVVQALVDRRESILALQKIISSDSGAVISTAAPRSETGEEQQREYAGLRATAHRIEAAVTVSALGTIWVVARKAALVASLLSTVPAWMRLDPMPILSSGDGPDDDGASGGGKAAGDGKRDGAIDGDGDGEDPASADSVEHLFTVEGAATPENRNAG